MPNIPSIPRSKRSRYIYVAPYSSEEIMENTSNILTVKEVADTRGNFRFGRTVLVTPSSRLREVIGSLKQ